MKECRKSSCIWWLIPESVWCQHVIRSQEWQRSDATRNMGVRSLYPKSISACDAGPKYFRERELDYSDRVSSYFVGTWQNDIPESAWCQHVIWSQQWQRSDATRNMGVLSPKRQILFSKWLEICWDMTKIRFIASCFQIANMEFLQLKSTIDWNPILNSRKQ